MWNAGKLSVLMVPAQEEWPAQDWDCLAETIQYPVLTVSVIANAGKKSALPPS